MHAVLADRDDLARLARDIRKAPCDMAPGIEEADLQAAHCRPGTRRWIAAANEVVDHINGSVPVDLRLGILAPAFVCGERLILRHFNVTTGDDEIRRFEHCRDS